MAAVTYKIARGYAPQVKAIAEANPGMTPIAAAAKWANERVGSWITDNLTQDYTMDMQSPSEVVILFDDVLDAQAFVARMGGRQGRAGDE